MPSFGLFPKLGTYVSLLFRNSEGGSPVCFLNNLLKYKGFSYPTMAATSAIE